MSDKSKAEKQYAKAVDFYSEGRHKKAFKWYRKAADQGHADAQFKLGAMYVNGRGVKQSEEEAEKWWRLAAEQGDANAQYNLGLIYDLGRGIKQNHPEAAKWYRLAAEQGHSSAKGALKNVGVCL